MEPEDEKLMKSSTEILHQLGFVPIKIRRRARRRASAVEEDGELADATSGTEEERGGSPPVTLWRNG